MTAKMNWDRKAYFIKSAPDKLIVFLQTAEYNTYEISRAFSAIILRICLMSKKIDIFLMDGIPPNHVFNRILKQRRDCRTKWWTRKVLSKGSVPYLEVYLIFFLLHFNYIKHYFICQSIKKKKSNREYRPKSIKSLLVVENLIVFKLYM